MFFPNPWRIHPKLQPVAENQLCSVPLCPALLWSCWSQKESPFLSGGQFCLHSNHVFSGARCFFFLTKIKPQPVTVKGKAEKQAEWQQSCRWNFRLKGVKLRTRRTEHWTVANTMPFLGCQARRGKPQCVSGSIHCISGFLTAPHFLHFTSLLFPDKLFLIFTIHFKPTIPSCLLLILAGAITPNFTERNKATRTFYLKFRIFIPTCLLHWESFGQYSFFLVPSSFFERFLYF